MIFSISNKEDLDSKLQEAGNKLVVIDFYATWCGPCKTIAPEIEKLSQEFTDVIFIKIDVEDSDVLANEYSIDSMPTFIFIKNKERIETSIGANVNKIRSLIETHK